MDSTPIEAQHKSSASKLPVKRKTPLEPNPPLLDPDEGRAPPFKFHRIWTEPDEIRFLQGLVDCSSQKLAFPRDLGIFYARFSNTMPQPYTKSQLSEKLRRLRKKYRVISTRLAKGLDRSQLSLHDRALYDLSKRLWHPDFAATSPFNGARNVGFNNDNNYSNKGDEGVLKMSSLVGIKVDFSPTLQVIASCSSDQEFDRNNINVAVDCVDNENVDDDKGGIAFVGGFGDYDSKNDEELKLSEVNVKFEGEEATLDDDSMHCSFDQEVGQNVESDCKDKIGEVVEEVVMNVFDECLQDMKRKFLVDQGGERVNGDYESLQLRWQQQRIAELDVLGSRLRLFMGHSLQRQ